MPRNHAEPGRSDPAGPFAALLDHACGANEQQPASPKNGLPIKEPFSAEAEAKAEAEVIGIATGGKAPPPGPHALPPTEPVGEQKLIAEITIECDTTLAGATEPLMPEPPAPSTTREIAPEPAVEAARPAPSPESNPTAVSAAPQQPAPPALIAPAETLVAPVAPVAAAAPNTDAGAAGRPTQPQNAAKATTEAERMTQAAPSGSSPPDPVTPRIAGEAGDAPGDDRPVSRAPSQAEPDAPPDTGDTPAARPHNSSDSSSRTQSPPDASKQPDGERASRPDRVSDAPPRPQPDRDGASNGSVRGPDQALQSPGLTGHASQTAVMHVTQATASAQAGPSMPKQDTPALVPLAGLAVEIATAAHAGKQRFEIRLDPPDLGRIDVRLDVDREGNVTSRMTVERADTLDLLRRDAAQLERALQQAGLKTSDHALEFSLRQHAFARDQQAPESSVRLLLSEDDPAPLEAARHGYLRLHGVGAGLDIRV